MTLNHLALHLLGIGAHISTNHVMHVSTMVTFSETDKLDPSCNDNITIWERKRLPCMFAITTWLVNISFYICSMFLHSLWLLS